MDRFTHKLFAGAAFEKAGWNKAKAARLLDVSRGTLYKLIKEHNLEDPG
jgi:transcriptional regulator of acetoin/glycerol metabolism